MSDKDLSPEEVAQRRDEAIKRMIATPPTTHKGVPKRAPQKPSKRGS